MNDRPAIRAQFRGTIGKFALDAGFTAPAKGVTVWGPTPAFYHLLSGQTRERLLVQAERAIDVQAYLRAWLAAFKMPPGVGLSVDVDPQSFM